MQGNKYLKILTKPVQVFGILHMPDIRSNRFTVEALVSDHFGNSKKWAYLELVAYENEL